MRCKLCLAKRLSQSQIVARNNFSLERVLALKNEQMFFCFCVFVCLYVFELFR